MSGNSKTEQNGIAAVYQYEKANGRCNVQRVHKIGYDLVSRGNGEERHIEVKSTDKDRFTSRWLEQLEYEALQKDPLFHLYLVTNASGMPRVWEYDKAKALNRFSKVIQQYVFVFPRDDFNK